MGKAHGQTTKIKKKFKTASKLIKRCSNSVVIKRKYTKITDYFNTDHKLAKKVE